MSKIFCKILMILLIVISILNMSANTIYAAVEVSMNKAYVKKVGQADYHLKYYREERDEYTYLICSIVGYDTKDGFTPAYCMNRNLDGAEKEAYYVTTESVLKNDRVWRVIKNGYPFKTAEQMGLTSKYDAYAVTKFAVYCMLGEADIKYFKAEKDDKEAVAMLNVLKKLVQIGNKGTEKQEENPLDIVKVKDMYEEDNYYIQEYEVTSKSEFKTYTVSAKGLTKNSFVADVNGKKRNSFNKENNFRIYVPKSEVTEDINGKVTISADCKVYLILEGKTTVAKTQNYVITTGESSKATAEEDIKIKREILPGSLKISKVDKENKDVKIEGVKFDLYNEKNSKIGTYITDINGEIFIENLEVGKYKLKEVETNKWYNLDTKEEKIEIKENQTTEITLENEPKKGQIKIIKVDSDNNEIKLKGVKFEVQDENGNILETIVTNENGEATTAKYELKDYQNLYLKEIETGGKYILNNNIEKIELEENKIKNVILKNKKIKGKIKIIKTSKDDNKITGDRAGSPLKNVKFAIYNQDNKFIETITTDKNGVAMSSDLEKGEYKIKETETNKYYYLNKNEFHTEITKDGEIVNVAIQDESKKPSVEVEKSGSEKANVGEKIEYDISVKNSGNTMLKNFIMQDIIPSKYVKVTNFKTGTFNQDLEYDLYYKSNLSNGYILLMEDLNSKENYEINFDQELAENEYITEIKMDFGSVDIGFSSNENPHLTGTVKKNVGNKTTFTNIAYVSGNFENHKVTDSSKWKTIAYKVLPKTGF